MQVSLFVAGAVLGEVQVSLLVAGAVLGEIWKDSRSAKCSVFRGKISPGARKITSVARRVGTDGFGLGSFSERCRIGRALEMNFSCFHQISVRFWVVILPGRRNIW